MKERAEELKAEARRGPRGQGGRGERRAREDRRDAGTGSRHGQAAPCDHQSQRAGPLAQDLVGDARVCGGRQGRLLLPKCAEVLLPPVWGGVTRAPDSASSRDEVVYETGPRRDPWRFRPPRLSTGPWTPALTWVSLERTTGFEPATPTLAMAWRMSHASPPVSAVPLTCTFLALLSHPSHQMAGVDSISLVISLVAGPQESRCYARLGWSMGLLSMGIRSRAQRSGSPAWREAARRRRLESEGRLAAVGSRP